MNFSGKLVEWQRNHGRHHLPWQANRDPYRIWVSEIMLQQTQVATVIPYYERFMSRFRDIASLAQSSEEEVLRYWAGLGYYARGRNLHRAAQIISDRHAGIFPRSYDEIVGLPGIGRSTAAAISVFALGERRAILDGNVKRVLARVFAIEGWPGDRQVENKLWQQSESLLPEKDIEAYTQGLMDLGSSICVRRGPRCDLCPFQAECAAARTGRVHELPGPRPRKSLPVRSSTLLVIRHGRDVLLVKRPAQGIWGGLWSLPEADGGYLPACLQLTGQPPSSIKELDEFSHGFTHFRLDIKPVILTIDKPPLAASSPGSVWMDAAESVMAAVPKPVKSILQKLES